MKACQNEMELRRGTDPFTGNRFASGGALELDRRLFRCPILVLIAYDSRSSKNLIVSLGLGGCIVSVTFRCLNLVSQDASPPR